MKAWNDLLGEVSLYWTGLPDNPDSHWYLDHGVKIEKFKDGTFEISNTMIAGDWFRPITNEQYDFFVFNGWLAGCYKVCIDTYIDRMIRVHEVLNRYPDNIDFIGRKNNIQKKINRYYQLMDNL